MSRPTSGQTYPRPPEIITGTAVNTPNTFVKRDGAGSFAAQVITAVTVIAALTGNVTGNLTGNVTGNVSGSSGSTTGNAATATKLATARAINGVNFDGTAAITVTADANTLTNTTLKSTVVTTSITSVGASLSIGTTPAAAGTLRMPTASATRTRNNANSGDVQVWATDSSDIVTFGGTSNSPASFVWACDSANQLTLDDGILVASVDNDIDLGSTSKYFKTSYTYALRVKASSSSLEPLILPHGSDPSAPTDGSIWTTTSGLKARINGATVTFATGSGISGLTTGTLPKAASSTTLTNSVMTESSGLITIDSSTGAIAVGQNTASAGRVRLPNNGSVQYRNQANSGNIIGFKVGTDNVFYVATDSDGSSNTGVTVNGNFLVFADNTYNLGATGANRFGSILAATAFIVGNTPATAGGVRLPNNTNFSFRNNGNTANVAGMLLTTGDNFQVGASGAGAVQIANTSGVVQLNGATWVYAGDLLCSNGTASNRWSGLFTGGIATNALTKTANYTLLATDHTCYVDTTSGNVTITLPAAASHTGRCYTIVRTSAGANTLTVSGTVSGVASPTIVLQYGVLAVQSDGTGWYKIFAV